MHANYKHTKVFRAEFSVRYFIENYPQESMKLLRTWLKDENHHVRRLVSEGTRPRLSWASRLPASQKDPMPVISLLDGLKADPELYVRRSVANNLNDIVKDHPNVVIETLKACSKNKNEHKDWIVKHASRSLIKMGHSEALILQGFDPNVKVQINNFQSNEFVQFGEYLEFEYLEFDFDLLNQEKVDARVVVDFVVYFKKANGKLSPKVFKLSEKKLKLQEILKISKRHPILEISTRKYYNGMQRLAIQANGKEIAEEEFELLGI
jgi:3-methyladenine DNA glycosylase AlkC